MLSWDEYNSDINTSCGFLDASSRLYFTNPNDIASLNIFPPRLPKFVEVGATVKTRSGWPAKIIHISSNRQVYWAVHQPDTPDESDPQAHTYDGRIIERGFLPAHRNDHPADIVGLYHSSNLVKVKINENATTEKNAFEYLNSQGQPIIKVSEDRKILNYYLDGNFAGTLTFDKELNIIDNVYLNNIKSSMNNPISVPIISDHKGNTVVLLKFNKDKQVNIIKIYNETNKETPLISFNLEN